jgi:hypothetical protein
VGPVRPVAAAFDGAYFVRFVDTYSAIDRLGTRLAGRDLHLAVDDASVTVPRFDHDDTTRRLPLRSKPDLDRSPLDLVDGHAQLIGYVHLELEHEWRRRWRFPQLIRRTSHHQRGHNHPPHAAHGSSG